MRYEVVPVFLLQEKLSYLTRRIVKHRNETQFTLICFLQPFPHRLPVPDNPSRNMPACSTVLIISPGEEQLSLLVDHKQINVYQRGS